MSGIFGLIHLDGAPVDNRSLEAMQRAMAHWGPDGGSTWHEGSAALGSLILFNTPESLAERLPKQSGRGFVLTAEARLDNRPELCAELGLDSDQSRNLPDGDLILRAYERWADESPHHLLGDWSFAVWHAERRRLFLARDHFGNTGLYYFADQHRFAFASDRKALLALGIPRRLNEFFLACTLVSWPAHHGSQTIELDLHRLPPAHTLTLDNGTLKIHQYWRLEDVQETRLGRTEDYVDGFLEVYQRAVRDRLRSHRGIAVSLSGGLDSGSTAALMARHLGTGTAQLTAYTSVPEFEVNSAVGADSFGDESRLARATAGFAGIRDVRDVRSREITPIQGIERTLQVHLEPGHAAGNAYWIQALISAAHKDGVGTLLTGQGGNATVSWTGLSKRAVLRAYARQRLWRSALKFGMFSLSPSAVHPFLYRLMGRHRHTWPGSAIHPDFVRRLGLAEQYVQHADQPTNFENWQPALAQRFALIRPGQSFLGSIWAETSASCSMEIRDATFDKRLMEFTLAVPDRFFFGPAGEDRWLIRQAMQGLLPEDVRRNSKRGLQAADLGHRLLSSGVEVETTLKRLESSHLAPRYLALDRMRRAWTALQEGVTPASSHRAGTILARGLMAGLYLAQLEGPAQSG